MDDRISRDVFLYNTVKERLQAMYDLAEDDPALLDTLEGETSLFDRLGLVAESALDDEAHAEACEARAEAYKLRAGRLLKRAQHKRNIVKWAMSEIGQKSIILPHITLSTRMGKAKVTIDEKLLPDDYKKTVTKLVADRDLIDTGLELGTDIPGVTVSNAEPVLSLRSK